MSVWVELWVRLKVVDLVAQTAWLTLTEKLDFKGRIYGLMRYSYWGFTAEGSDGESIVEQIDRVVRIDSAFTNQNKHRYRLMILENTAERGLPLEDDASVRREAVDDRTAARIPAARTPAENRDQKPRRAALRALGMDGQPAPAVWRGDLPLESDYALHEDVAGQARGELYAIDCLVRERNGEREAGFADRLNGRMSEVNISGMKTGEVWRIIVSAGGEEEALDTVERMTVTRSRREGLLLNPHYQSLELISASRRASAGKGAKV